MIDFAKRFARVFYDQLSFLLSVVQDQLCFTLGILANLLSHFSCCRDCSFESFIAATSDNASLVNEQNALTIKGERMTVVCKQIAGVLARRIVCWKRPGDSLELGERFGLIKFGSRTDLIMPPEVEVLVRVGERVSGGVTVIGRYLDGE